jgi:hypothetical protein
MLKFATTPIELSRCFPVLQQLRPHLQLESGFTGLAPNIKKILSFLILKIL